MKLFNLGFLLKITAGLVLVLASGASGLLFVNYIEMGSMDILFYILACSILFVVGIELNKISDVFVSNDEVKA